MAGLADLEGRNAVVTGAASGIGLATTEAFVAAGMRVLMTDLDAVLLASHAERLATGGAEVRALVVDVTDPDAVERARTSRSITSGNCTLRSTTPASWREGTRGSSRSPSGTG